MGEDENQKEQTLALVDGRSLTNRSISLVSRGLEQISTILPIVAQSVFLNRMGVPAGTVEYHPDEKRLITTGENPDFISALMSFWQIAWDKVSAEDKLTFSRHMGLLVNRRTSVHREVFSYAMLHLIVELKTSGAAVSEPIAGVIRLLPECVLPQLPRPLSNEVKYILMKSYGKAD